MVKTTDCYLGTRMRKSFSKNREVLEMPNLSNRQGTGGPALPRWPSNIPGGQPSSASPRPPHLPGPLPLTLPSGWPRSRPRAL